MVQIKTDEDIDQQLIARAFNAIMEPLVVTPQSQPEAAEALQNLMDRIIIAARSATPVEQVGQDKLALLRWMKAPFLH